MEGGKSLLAQTFPPPSEWCTKGKGKAVASSEPPLFVEKPTSPPSVEALMSDLSLFEQSLLKDSNEIISSLGSVYKKEAKKKVRA